MASNDVLIKLVADVTGLQKELGSVKKDLDSVGKTASDSANSIGSAFKKVGGIIAGALAVDKIVSFGKDCIELGANVQEMENKFNVVFGDMAKDVDKWAGDFTKAIGRNKNDIKGAVASQVDLMMGFGMTGTEALKLAQDLTSLAIDLGSFNNVADDESILKLQKAIMGLESSGALESLGVDLTETTMATSKFTEATGKKWSELSRAEKMEVRYQEALSQSARAVGDAERSMDSYTAQQKVLNATVTNVKETIGMMLLPMMTELTKSFNGVAEKCLVFTQGFQEAYTATGDFSTALATAFDNMGLEWIGDIVRGVDSVIEKFKEMINWFKEHELVTQLLTGVIGGLLVVMAGFKIIMAINNGIKTATAVAKGWNASMLIMKATLQGASFSTMLLTAKTTIWTAVSTLATTVTTAFGVAMAFLTSPIGIVIMAIVGLVAVGYLLIKNWDTVKEFLLACWEGIKVGAEIVWEGIKAFIVGTCEVIGAIVKGIWEGIKWVIDFVCKAIYLVVTTWWELVKLYITVVMTVIKTVITTIWNVIKAVIGTICKVIYTVVTTIWDAIYKFIKPILELIQTVITFVWQSIQMIIAVILTVILGIVKLAWEGIKVVVETMMNIIKGIISVVWNVIKVIVETVMNVIKTVVSTVWEAIKVVTEIMMNIIKTIVSTVWEAIKVVITTVMNVIKAIVTTVWNAISGVISTVCNTIKSIVSAVWNAISGVISSVCNAIKSVVTTIWNGIKSVISGVVDGIKSAVTTGFNTVKSSLTSICNGIKGVVMGIWNGIGKGIQGVINGIIGCINGMVRAMNKISFDVPDWVPIMGGKKFGFNIPEVSKVSWFANGGIIKGTEGGSIIGVGEAGDEAVVPLSNKTKMKPFARAVAGFMPDGAGAGSSGETTLNINVSELVVREEADVQRISRELFKMIENRKRGMGNR